MILCDVALYSRNITQKLQATSITMSRRFLGEVIGAKNLKTIQVRVEKIKMHPIVLKPVISYKKYQVHDESSEAVVGDIVRIESCPKISVTKSFKLSEIVTPANRYTDPETGAFYSIKKDNNQRRDRPSDYGAELYSGKFYPSK